MSFSDTEISTQDGRPIALYLIQWGNTIWAYTSADRDIEYETPGLNDDGTTRLINYVAVACSDTGMVQGGSSQNDFTLSCPANLPIVELFRGTPPSLDVFLTVRRLHYGDTEAPIYWTGFVTNVKRSDGYAEAQVIGQPITATFKRTGLRLAWTRECPHFLYDQGCKVDPEAWRHTATITAMTGNSITVDTGGVEANWYRGGYVEWAVNEDGTLDRRMIEAQSGDLLTIFGVTDRMEVGMEVSIFPGCDRTAATCQAKFNNLANEGGFEFLPGKTPFSTLIF